MEFYRLYIYLVLVLNIHWVLKHSNLISDVPASVMKNKSLWRLLKCRQVAWMLLMTKHVRNVWQCWKLRIKYLISEKTTSSCRKCGTLPLFLFILNIVKHRLYVCLMLSLLTGCGSSQSLFCTKPEKAEHWALGSDVWNWAAKCLITDNYNYNYDLQTRAVTPRLGRGSALVL